MAALFQYCGASPPIMMNRVGRAMLSIAANKGSESSAGNDPPGETTFDPWCDEPFSDYDTEPVMVFPPPETSGKS